MADKDHATQPDDTDDPGADATEVGADADVGSAGDGDADPEDVEEPEEGFDGSGWDSSLQGLASPSGSGALGRVVLSARNQARIGELTLHYEARSVVLYMDGDAALRIIELYRRRNSRTAAVRLADPFDPARSDAGNGWVSLDLDDHRLLAVSWIPLPPQPRPRTVIDPLPS